MSGASSAKEPPIRVPLGGDYWQVEPGTSLWGFADLHAHLMAHLAFGGKVFWGRPYDADHPGAAGMEYALSSCEPAHGGLINLNLEFGHAPGGGWPDFAVWPRFTTLTHQQAYVDWLYRAYQGGLRLISCLAVNNEIMAARLGSEGPCDDKSAILVQVTGMKEMVAVLDRQCGGPGRAWLQIAYSPEEARAIIGSNRLAVILGVEVDSLGNWRRFEDLDAQCGQDMAEARRLIGEELDWLFTLGVRQITPIHLTDNAFGGTAIYRRLMDATNLAVTGRHFKLEDGWYTGVRYRFDLDAAGLTVESAGRVAALEGQRLSPERPRQGRSLLHRLPGIKPVLQALEAPKVGRAHVNALGLTKYGMILLEEMMSRGMILDVDHMSQKALDVALALAEANDYPVICSHTWFRDLAFSADIEYRPSNQASYGTADVHKVANEAGKRADQVELIGRLGGVVAPILTQGDMAGLARALPRLAGQVPEPCAGSSTAWAEGYLYAVHKMGGRGVALGSDLNGAAGLPAPRFGTSAAYGARDDAYREIKRRRQIDRQTAGVRYQEPLRDYRWFRFEYSGPGAYDEDECETWQAIAQYRAGFDPRIHQHPAADRPTAGQWPALATRPQHGRQDVIDSITTGLWMAEEDKQTGRSEIPTDWPIEQQAAYLACRRMELTPAVGERISQLVEKIKDVLARWQAMDGPNPPLKRCTAGPRRDFDINLDGMAHYGLLPDFLQDVKNLGLTQQDLVPLFRSAEDYVAAWEKCRRRAGELASPAPWLRDALI